VHAETSEKEQEEAKKIRTLLPTIYSWGKGRKKGLPARLAAEPTELSKDPLQEFQKKRNKNSYVHRARKRQKSMEVLNIASLFRETS